MAGRPHFGHVDVHGPEAGGHVQRRDEQAIAHALQLEAQLSHSERFAAQGTHELPAALPLLGGSFRAQAGGVCGCRGGGGQHTPNLFLAQGCALPTRVGVHDGQVEAEGASVHTSGQVRCGRVLGGAFQGPQHGGAAGTVQRGFCALDIHPVYILPLGTIRPVRSGIANFGLINTGFACTVRRFLGGVLPLGHTVVQAQAGQLHHDG